MQPYQDHEITCVDCKTTFTDRVRDQEFREQKGWGTTPPRRCKECRIKKRQQREGGSY